MNFGKSMDLKYKGRKSLSFYITNTLIINLDQDSGKIEFELSNFTSSFEKAKEGAVRYSQMVCINGLPWRVGARIIRVTGWSGEEKSIDLILQSGLALMPKYRGEGLILICKIFGLIIFRFSMDL